MKLVTEGIIEIMREEHMLLPGHTIDNQLRTFFIVDLVNVERVQNTQNDKQDKPKNRLEGLIPGLADFHTFGNFLEV